MFYAQSTSTVISGRHINKVSQPISTPTKVQPAGLPTAGKTGRQTYRQKDKTNLNAARTKRVLHPATPTSDSRTLFSLGNWTVTIPRNLRVVKNNFVTSLREDWFASALSFRLYIRLISVVPKAFVSFSIALCPQKPSGLLGTGSQGRSPWLSHSSWLLFCRGD